MQQYIAVHIANMNSAMLVLYMAQGKMSNMHSNSRLKKSNKMQQYADIYLFTAKLLYMFWASITPIIRST